MTTEEKINQLEAAFKAQIDELRKEVKPKFEVGRWYKDPKSLHMVCVQKENARLRFDGFGYGIACDGSWGNDLGLDGSEIPATDKEVEEALIKEAERRGFKEGIKIYFAEYSSDIVETRGKLEFMPHNGKLMFDTGTVFYKGKWAEIIKDEPIRVGGVDCVVDSCGAWFDKNQYSWEEINSLVKVFKNHSSQLKSINVGCSWQYKVDLELLEKILALKR